MVTRGGLQRPTTRSRREEEGVTDARIAVISDTHGRALTGAYWSPAPAPTTSSTPATWAPWPCSRNWRAWRRSPPCAATATAAAPCADLPAEAVGEVAGLRFVVAHKRRDLKAGHPDPVAEGLRLLVYGDTHRPELRYRGHAPGQIPVLWLNPGSCMAPLPHDPRPKHGVRRRARRRAWRAPHLLRLASPRCGPREGPRPVTSASRPLPKSGPPRKARMDPRELRGATTQSGGDVPRLPARRLGLAAHPLAGRRSGDEHRLEGVLDAAGVAHGHQPPPVPHPDGPGPAAGSRQLAGSTDNRLVPGGPRLRIRSARR